MGGTDRSGGVGLVGCDATRVEQVCLGAGPKLETKPGTVMGRWDGMSYVGSGSEPGPSTGAVNVLSH